MQTLTYGKRADGEEAQGMLENRAIETIQPQGLVGYLGWNLSVHLASEA